MREERNVYWDYKNGSSKWRSKKFMDFENELKPKKISCVAYSKKGYVVKRPLWLFSTVVGENFKLFIRKAGEVIASVAMVEPEAIEVYLNKASMSVIFVVDCSYLTKLLGVKVKDEDGEKLRDLQRLIVDLLLTITMGEKYIFEEDKNNPYSYSDMIDIDSYERMDYLFQKNDLIYSQEEFCNSLYTEIDKKFNEQNNKIEKLKNCCVFRSIVNNVSAHKNDPLVKYLADIFYKISGEMLLPFLLAHLGEGKGQGRNRLLALPWKCNRICGKRCGLHHPMDLLFLQDPMPVGQIDLSAFSAFLPSVNYSLFINILNLNALELALFLFCSSRVLEGYQVNVGRQKQVPSFSFALYTRDAKRAVGLLEGFKAWDDKLCDERITKHKLAQELKNRNNISLIYCCEEGFSFFDELLKKSRTSQKDLYQIRKSLSPVHGESECGVLNNMFFCSDQILAKILRSNIFRTGILKFITFINIDRGNLSVDVESILYLVNEFKSCFDKNNGLIKELDEPNFLSLVGIFPKEKIYHPLYVKNCLNIYVILNILIADRAGDEYKNVNEQAVLLAEQLANKLSAETKAVFDRNQRDFVVGLVKKFIIKYKYEFIYERELRRNFSASSSKKYLHDVIELLCSENVLIKFSRTPLKRPGRKSSTLYRININA